MIVPILVVAFTAVAVILAAGLVALGLVGTAGWVILVTASVAGIILWIASTRWRLRWLSWGSLLWTWFVGLLVFGWVTHLYTGEWSTFFLFNGLNESWTPPWFFKWWGFILLILALVLWHLSRRVETMKRRRLYANLCRLITGFLLVVAICSLNWTDLPPFSRTGDHPAKPTALVAPAFKLKDNGNLTITVTAPKPPKPGERQYQWSVSVTSSLEEIKQAIPGTAYTETSKPLPGPGDYTVKLRIKVGQKTSPWKSDHILVKSADGKQPAGNPKQTPQNGCPDTWVISKTDHTGHALTAAQQPIFDAYDHKSTAEARQAWQDWLNQVKGDPAVFAAVVQLNLYEMPEAGSLVDAGCASSLAKSYLTQLLGFLKDPKFQVTPDLAPANGTEIGWDGNKVVVSTTQAVSGDRRAIKVVLPDGRTYWVLGRNGDVVFRGEPPVNEALGNTGEAPRQVEAAGPGTTHGQTAGQPASTSSAHRPGTTSSSSRTTATTTSSAARTTAAPRTTQAPRTSVPAATTSTDKSAAPWTTWGNGPGPTTTRPAPTTAPLTTIPPVTEGSSPTPPSGTAAPSSSAYATSGPGCDPNTGNGC